MSISQPSIPTKILNSDHRLLEESIAQNSRIRQLLNRVATGVKEYDVTQTSLMTLLGTPYKGLPPELLDTFGHDPSAVTTKTGRYRGWRAVDDIHDRILRQREIFEDFLAHNRDDTGSVVEEDVLENPIRVLRQSLDTLAVNKAAVASRADEVAELLKTVQETHQKVKDDYKDTVAHTSVVYPEVCSTFASCRTSPDVCSSVVSNRGARGKLQRSISAFLGNWHGCPDVPA